MKNNKGFTLVELLVVIAIIGILSTVAVVNLNSAREKAREASVKGNLVGLIPAVVLCHDESEELTEDGTAGTVVDCSNDAGDVPVAGGEIFAWTDSAVWPTLESAWSYLGYCSSTASTGAFGYGATDGTTSIFCNESGCQ